MILSLRSCRECSVSLERLKMERDSTDSACVDVWFQSQCRSGVTLRTIPKDIALAVIRFRVLIGVKKGDLNNR